MVEDSVASCKTYPMAIDARLAATRLVGLVSSPMGITEHAGYDLGGLDTAVRRAF